jgi:phage-related tail protein
MDANTLINRAKEATDKLYYDNDLGKKDFHIGYLESTIRMLVTQLNHTNEMLENATDEIETLQYELKEKS